MCVRLPAWYSGSRATATASRARRSRIPAGSPGGPNSASHDVWSTPSTPAAAMVGTLGNDGSGRGLVQLENTLAMVRENLNPHVGVEGIVATMFDGRTLHSREAIEILDDPQRVGMLVGAGFVVFFLAERLLVLHHRDAPEEAQAHSHVGALGAGAVAIHTFIDGLGIGIAFSLDTATGVLLAVRALLPRGART